MSSIWVESFTRRLSSYLDEPSKTLLAGVVVLRSWRLLLGVGMWSVEMASRTQVSIDYVAQ